MEAQAKAEANKILSNFKQVDGAIKVFAAENGGAMPDCATDWPVNCALSTYYSSSELAGFLEPSYIQQGVISSLKITLYRHPTMTNGFLTLAGPSFKGLTEAVCRHLEGLRAGNVPTVNRQYTTGASGPVNMSVCGQFGCFADNVSNSWGSSDYIAYFRLAGPPVPTLADCTINP
jgi:hypothetical protein